MKEKLYIIIPCYNEQEVLPITSKLFLEELIKLIEKNKISDDSRILFVNDGSKDNTWQIIKDKPYFAEVCYQIPILIWILHIVASKSHCFAVI